MEYLIAISVFVLAILYLWKSKSRNLPPGPWGLPIVGYLPFLGSKPYLELGQLAKKYGSIFSIRLGSNYIIVLDDFQSTKEAFNIDALIARPPEFPFQQNERTLETGAFIGPAWRAQRRVSVHTLRNLGFGKTKMEQHIHEEIEELLELFQKYSGKPFNPRPLLSSSMSNNITSLVFGKRLKYDDPVRHALNDLTDETIIEGQQVSFVTYFPWLKTLCKILGIGGFNKSKKAIEIGRELVMKEIEDHEKTVNPSNIRDFVDGYLLEIPKKKDDPAFDKLCLQDLAIAFFNAGSETVRTTLEWLIILVAEYPNLQHRIHVEIDDVVGKDRLPVYEDSLKMPYTNAFIMEMQRWMTLVPLNLLRYTIADIEFKGYFIPKNTRILNNLWSIHHDKEYWGEDADDFNPERFLAEDGKTLKKFDRYIPFSIGKRACPGEGFAKIEMFIYFVALMQKFTIRFPGGKKANFETDLGFTIKPKPQDVIMTKRS